MFKHDINPELVYVDEYGIRGTNFYWQKYEAKGLTKEDILATGLTSDRVEVHKDIIEPLLAVDRAFGQRGFRLYIKEGYRSKALYELIYKRRVEKFGQADTDRLFNMRDMPHATGRSVDVALWDKKEDREIFMRNGADGTDALFVGFYRGKTDEPSRRYEELQRFVIETMLSNGFKLGTKNEYFHFDYCNG